MVKLDHGDQIGLERSWNTTATIGDNAAALSSAGETCALHNRSEWPRIYLISSCSILTTPFCLKL